MFDTIAMDELHDMVDALSAALEAKSAYTCGHSERVAEISLLLARQMDLPLREQTRIHIGAHLHDIGKIGIPDAILDKPGRLTPAEFAVIKKHPEIGGQIVNKARWFQSVVDIVRNHHERYDGGGYPDKLRKNEISLAARIVAVADAFDAMTSPRPYRAARSAKMAVEEMLRCSGTQFDPAAIAALVEAMDAGKLAIYGCGRLEHLICRADWALG